MSATDSIHSALVVIITTCVVILAVCFCIKHTPARRTPRASGKYSSILRGANTCEERIKLLVVHHGTEDDLFWKDVEKGFNDAENLLNGIDMRIVRGLNNMENGIRSALGNADGLIVTCPYVKSSTPEKYAMIDEGIKSVIEQGIPVITFNTDTYHNREVFQYVGSFNRDLGKRAAIAALKKYPQLLPENKELLIDQNLSTSCEEKVALIKKQCEDAGSRKISHVIGMLQEDFNVTLDWRIEEFYSEWCQQTSPFLAPTLVKTYTKAEARAEVEKVFKSSSEEGCILVPCGVMVLQDCIDILNEFKSRNAEIYACQVGDTGKLVSRLAGENDIPFVGQMPYHQGFSCITSMHNIIKNYNYGKSWEREKGNSAVVVEASYECTGDCNIETDIVSRRIKQKSRHRDAPWIQVGVAITIEGIDIAAWDQYEENNVGKTNTVYLYEGGSVNVNVVNGAEHFNASYDGKDGKRLYKGMLGEFIKVYPLYERVLDVGRNQHQYYIVMNNGTRMQIAKSTEKLRSEAFVRSKYTQNTYKVQLYEDEDMNVLQRILKGSLGNRCMPCV